MAHDDEVTCKRDPDQIIFPTTLQMASITNPAIQHNNILQAWRALHKYSKLS